MKKANDQTVIGAKSPVDGFFECWCLIPHEDEQQFRADYEGYEFVKMTIGEMLIWLKNNTRAVH